MLAAALLHLQNAKTRVDERSFAFYRWALSLPESGIAVPATLVSGLGCFQRARHARETQKRAYIDDLRAIFCVIPGFWLRWALSWPESGIAVPATLVFGLGCLQRAPLRQGNAKTRVDERSTRDFAFYLAFGRAGLCRGRNPG